MLTDEQRRAGDAELAQRRLERMKAAHAELCEELTTLRQTVAGVPAKGAQ